MSYTGVTLLIGKETGAGNADVVAPAGLGSKGRKTDCAGVGSSMGVVVSTGRKTDGAGANVVEFSSIGSTGKRLMAQVQGWLLPLLLGAIRQGWVRQSSSQQHYQAAEMWSV